MDRLTVKYSDTYAPQALCSFDTDGNATDCDLCYESCKALEDGNVDCTGCEVDRCFRRLAEYEDTGLTPDQIKEMDKLYAEKCKEPSELQESTLTGIELAKIWLEMERLKKYDTLSRSIGKEVYIINYNPPKLVTGEVVFIRIGAKTTSLCIYVPEHRQHINRSWEQVGKSVFFDQAAAKRKLNALQRRPK